VTTMQAETTQQENALPPGMMTPEELALFADMRARLAPALQAIVDLEGWQHGLTDAEWQILNLILDGHQHKEIAARAGIREKTVKQHVAAIFKKFLVASRAELSAKMFRMVR